MPFWNFSYGNWKKNFVRSKINSLLFEHFTHPRMFSKLFATPPPKKKHELTRSPRFFANENPTDFMTLLNVPVRNLSEVVEKIFWKNKKISRNQKFAKHRRVALRVFWAIWAPPTWPFSACYLGFVWKLFFLETKSRTQALEWSLKHTKQRKCKESPVSYVRQFLRYFNLLLVVRYIVCVVSQSCFFLTLRVGLKLSSAHSKASKVK